MEEYNDKFLKAFKKLLHEMQKVDDSKGISKLLKIFNKLDVNKLAIKYYDEMSKFSDQIMSLDKSMYNQSVMLPSGINLSEFINKVDDEVSKRLMSYVKIMLILSEIITKQLKIQKIAKMKAKAESTTESDKKSEIVFNPYEGIGGDKEYGVDEMFNGVELKVPDATPNFSTLAELVGLDKMVDLEKLTEELQNMNESSIDEATNNIKNMMGGNIDDNTTKTITSMLASISKELKTKDLKSGNIFDNLSEIANVVAEKMKPDVDNGNLDVKKLWDSTKQLATKCKDGDTDGFNPMEMLSEIVGKQFDEKNKEK